LAQTNDPADQVNLAAYLIMPSSMSSLHDNKQTGQPQGLTPHTIAKPFFRPGLSS
jgi:hypothetical protein